MRVVAQADDQFAPRANHGILRACMWHRRQYVS